MLLNSPNQHLLMMSELKIGKEPYEELAKFCLLLIFVKIKTKFQPFSLTMLSSKLYFKKLDITKD